MSRRAHKAVNTPRMPLWRLEEALGSLASFASPKHELEQYPTSPHLAARLLSTAAHSYDDIIGKRVADLGTGCGVLALGAALLDCSQVTAVDIDADALAVAALNLNQLQQDDLLPPSSVDFQDTGVQGPLVEFVNADVLEWKPNQTISEPGLVDNDGKASPVLRSGSAVVSGCPPDTADRGDMGWKFDTVLMNPPFGARPGCAGIDVGFLRKALEIAPVVYSLHKSSTRAYLEKKCTSWGCRFECIAQMEFDVQKLYKFHKKKSVDIKVDLIRVSQNRVQPPQLKKKPID